MEFYKASDLKKIAREKVSNILAEGRMYKTGMKKVVKETMNFDIFIAHSKLDEDIINGLYLDFKDKYDIDVYVDWIVDPQLSRDNVTTESALTLRNRMDQSNNLIYAVSNKMLKSVWTPWELGYFDGSNKPIRVLPILNDYESDYHGAEYVGVYDVIDKNEINTLVNNLNNPNFF